MTQIDHAANTRKANDIQLDALVAYFRRLVKAADAASGSITLQLGDAEGATAFSVKDSLGQNVLSLDSNGNLVVDTIAAGGPVWELGEYVEASGVDMMTYAATISLDITKPAMHKTTTVHATGNATINASAAGAAGQSLSVLIENDATSGKTITFGTNFRASATVVGTISKAAVVSFISDGAAWFEAGRALVL